MPQEEASTSQFILCLIWKLGDSNFWVKICLVLQISRWKSAWGLRSIFQVEWLIATLIFYFKIEVPLWKILSGQSMNKNLLSVYFRRNDLNIRHILIKCVSTLLINRFGISVPLTFLGAYLGFKMKVLLNVCFLKRINTKFTMHVTR